MHFLSGRECFLSREEPSSASWACAEGVQTFLFPLLGRPFLVPLLLGDWEALSSGIPPCLFTSLPTKSVSDQTTKCPQHFYFCLKVNGINFQWGWGGREGTTDSNIRRKSLKGPTSHLIRKGSSNTLPESTFPFYLNAGIPASCYSNKRHFWKLRYKVNLHGSLVSRLWISGT